MRGPRAYCNRRHDIVLKTIEREVPIRYRIAFAPDWGFFFQRRDGSNIPWSGDFPAFSSTKRLLASVEAAGETWTQTLQVEDKK